jgi:hypothetical protein
VVVMAFVLAQHGCGVPLVDDQEAVEEFAADVADETFGDRVGPRVWVPETLHTSRDLLVLVDQSTGPVASSGRCGFPRPTARVRVSMPHHSANSNTPKLGSARAKTCAATHITLVSSVVGLGRGELLGMLSSGS